MSGPNAAEQYNRELAHLVQAHGADSDLLIGYALNLTQLHWAHFDTHAALDIAQVRPPDGHVHPALPDPGGPGQPPASYRPFLPSPALAGGALPLSAPLRFHATADYTGLPQTGATPPASCLQDVTGCWSAEAASLAVSRARRGAWGEMDPELVLAGYRGELKRLADAAAARWLARTSFPSAPTRPGAARPPTVRPRGTQVPRAARGR
jgi:hypothetical protein